MKRWTVGFLFLAACSFAHADSWAPPERETYASADGVTRIVVTPRGIVGQLQYFSDKVDGKEPAAQADDAPSRPTAEVFVRRGGKWKFVRKFALVNDVAPVDAQVAEGGKYFVTFDNWHSVGFGPDVVVIYDADGRVIRSLSLENILPSSYIAHLPRSVSSMSWSNTKVIQSDGETLEVRLIPPGKDFGSKEYVPRHIRLSDGAVLPGGAEWLAALQQVTELERARQARWDAVRSERAKSLLPPQGTTSNDAWRAYMVELRSRLNEATGKRFSGNVYQPGEYLGDADFVLGDLIEYEDPEFRFSSNFLLVGPDTHDLAAVLADHLSKRPANALQGASIAFVGTLADRDVVNAVPHAGAEVEWIDASVPYPGQVLPPEMPEWFD